MAFSTHHQLQNKDFWLKLRVDKQILELKRQLAAKEGKNERFVVTSVSVCVLTGGCRLHVQQSCSLGSLAEVV